MNKKIILISMIATAVFGLIDGIFFLTTEISIQEQVVSFLRIQLAKKYELLSNPWIDAFGIMVGTILSIEIYYLFKHLTKDWKKVKAKLMPDIGKRWLRHRKHSG